MVNRSFLTLTLACAASLSLTAAPQTTAAKPAAAPAKPAAARPAAAKADYSRPYSLMAAASKVIQKGETPPQNLMFHAAIAADWTGDQVKSRDFLAYFLEKDQGSSTEVRRALVRLCSVGASPKYYERYLSLAPHDLDALALGLRQLEAFANDSKGREFAQQLKLLLDAYPEGAELNEIVRLANQSVFERNFAGISDGRAAMQALRRAANWKLIPRMSSFLDHYIHRDRYVQEDFYDLWKRHRDYTWSKLMLERLAQDPKTPQDDAVEMVRQILSLYGVNREHPDHYLGRFGRLEKHTRWMALIADAKTGKFPAEPGLDIYAATHRLGRWCDDFRGKKFDGRPEEAFKRAAEVFGKSEIYEFEDIGAMRYFCETCSRLAMENPKAAAAYPFEGFARFVFERIYFDFEPGLYTWIMRAYDAAGRMSECLDRLRAAADKAGSAVGVGSRRMGMACMGERKEGGWRTFLSDATYDWGKKEFTRPAPPYDRLAWNLEIAKRYAKAPVPELVCVPDMPGVSWDAFWRTAEGAKELKRDLTAEEKRYRTEADNVVAVYGRYLYPEGARRTEHQWGPQLPAEHLLYRKVEANAKDPLVPYLAATSAMNRRGDWREIVRSCNTLMTNGCVEIAYLLASRHRDIETVAELQRVRNEAASQMPGLYPVNEKDPAYPLYVAADALQRNNPERAWTLLSANTKVFDRDPMRYQPQFALWALDQYRKVRGPDDALRDKAWEHVETLLQKESSFPTEIAAGLFLLRAQIAEDRLNYEVAHAGYQAIRNHAQYQKTKAGRQAMFRDVELMMTMGSMDAASQVAEQWITMPEPDVRAQGHYILAKIAFTRKDYDETRKELDKVFEIDFTHAEGRLLQGEWKLATNYEVDDTQVLLGDLADRSAIRPGSPLSISVQDKNLSVAGGGASIPVVVTTSSGKDSERVLLYPGTRDPSLFRGSIDTVVGVATPGNSTLELAGDDIVSYQVDPEYLKNRGLKVERAKMLKVVDDAELTIGANKEVKTLKPGLPLPVRLVDRDRSRHSGAATASVQLMTTSGDRIPAAKLKETGVCTGVFTAEIKTSIPPPRAFASDSTSGAGPQDLISSTRNGTWQSLSDGEKPKSVGVDTMNSYLVSTASISMGAPEAIARLRLFGTLFGEEMLLGTYPAENAESRKGIHVINTTSNSRGRTDFMRELSKKIVTPVKTDVWGADHMQDGWHNLRHVIRGTVYIPSDTTLRLRLKPTHPDRDKPDEALRGLSLWMYVDGAEVLGYGERDMNAKRKTRTVSFDAGLHDIEIYAESHLKGDSFEVCREKDDGELVSLPKDWVDSAAHPELLTRLDDKCRIARGKTGFTATFDTPERLRTLRWEFTDFSGSSVSATKLSVTDKSGRQIIPSEHDYTEALGNDILEVAPGDMITVTYEDDVTSSGRSRAVERQIESTFADGEIEFLYEDLVRDARGRTRSEMFKAFRVAPGDALFVKLTDADLDVTAGPDKVKVVVATAGGKKVALTAVERSTRNAAGEEVVSERDAGVFYALVRTVPAGGEVKPGVLPLAPGEGLTAAYKDEDNLDPGVPVIREASIAAVPETKIELALAHTWGERGEDKSPEGQSKLLNVRRRAESANATMAWRTSWHGEYAPAGETAVVTPDIEIPVRLHAPQLVRHEGSNVKILIATQAEIDAASAEGREVEWAERTLHQRAPRMNMHVREGADGNKVVTTGKKLPESLFGVIDLYTSAAEERAAEADDEDDEYLLDRVEPVNAKAGDTIVVRCVDDGGKTLAETTAKIGTTAWIGLADATYEACNEAVHLGESFHILVVDPDRDVSDEQDEIEVEVATKGGVNRKLVLKETLARSGVFTCPVTPTIVTKKAAPASAGEAAPQSAVEEPAEADDPSVVPSKYGDEFTFTYRDESVGFGGKPGARTVVGKVLPGSDGEVRAYSKRFRDADQAVLVQFRLAECLFEMAKDFRKLKDAEKSAEAIADGRKILEQALRDYPNTSHAAEGEFLLANLYEQLAEEEAQSRKEREKNGEDLSKEKDKSDPLYREAAARFSAILSAWPEGDYAARSQYHKALCLEKLGDYARASEEYVKMTYLFPESPLVGDASVRLASYYYAKEKRYDIASKIYTSFRARFPAHPQAPNALFMGGQCLVKQAEKLENTKEEVRGKSSLIQDAYKESVANFTALVDNYKDIPNKELLAQALYWAGDVSFRLKDYPNAYIYLKRTTFEYPESKWARYARGMLLQEAKAFEEVAQ